MVRYPPGARWFQALDTTSFLDKAHEVIGFQPIGTCNLTCLSPQFSAQEAASFSCNCNRRVRLSESRHLRLALAGWLRVGKLDWQIPISTLGLPQVASPAHRHQSCIRQPGPTTHDTGVTATALNGCIRCPICGVRWRLMGVAGRSRLILTVSPNESLLRISNRSWQAV